MAKATAVREPFTKAKLIAELAADTGLSKKDINAVLESLAMIIQRHVKKRAVGQFTLPGLLKIKTVRKPARRERKGINPFTGEETTFKAKPAHTVVKILPLKRLKDMVL